MLLGARFALQAREAATEQAAVEVAFELPPHERRQRRSVETCCDSGVKRLNVVAHDRVERRRLRTMALVATGTPAVQSNHGKPHGLPAKRAPCRCLNAHISTELPA